MKRSILISVSLLYSRNDRNIVAVEFERTSSCSSVAGATNLNGDASIHYPVQHAFCEIGVREQVSPIGRHLVACEDSRPFSRFVSPVKYLEQERRLIRAERRAVADFVNDEALDV